MRTVIGRPLLGDARRIPAGLTVAACVTVVVALGLLFTGQTGPDWLDNAIDSPVITFFGGRSLLLWLAFPGTLIPAAAVSAAIVIACLITRRLNGAVLAAIAVPVAAGVGDGLLKPLFHRTYLGQVAFPSGHTASATALTATLAVLVLVPPQQARTRAARVTLVAVACVITAAVAVGVIGLRWHYFTDCLAGVAVGTGTVLALAFLIDLAPVVISSARKLPANRSPKRPAPSATSSYANGPSEGTVSPREARS
jgi:membrane-associated phospholipid phosphatase